MQMTTAFAPSAADLEDVWFDLGGAILTFGPRDGGAEEDFEEDEQDFETEEDGFADEAEDDLADVNQEDAAA
ncbi:hypothetical protein [Neotabrizicola sp. sgz301269]|uniref:hypothetical protein n=1 Tax=Neotabrizicola sp. sgz301269 TaxID=3276282 RepID=UPI00376F6881